MRAQVLDSMDLERERGITIKAQAVRVFYEARDGETYQLHLIDTPGHVDFTYEVSRSLAACEGALLVVDASQGVEAQTLANTYLAVESGLELIPVPEQDRPARRRARARRRGGRGRAGRRPRRGAAHQRARPGRASRTCSRSSSPRSRRPPAIPTRVPRALIFDSEFDQYRGVIAYIRVVDGVFKKGDAIRAMQAGTEADIDDIGFFTPAQIAGRPALRRRGRLPDHRHQGRDEAARRRHADHARRPARPSRCPATATSSRWSSAGCSRSTPTTSPSCATRSRSSRSTTRR